MPDSPNRARQLLDWYDRHRRDPPWRAPPGVRPDPYRVWLSEIMLQQTTVAAVTPRFEAFLARWSDVHALAAADRDDVLDAWAGLGYYARARNLHRCAQAVVADHGGDFPDTEPDLATLPGIGPYTAAAIAAIAFNRPAAAVDGNVERVIARLERIETPLPAAKPLIRKATETLVPAERPGDFAQALMDLGATICTPRKPACALCPWRDDCAARRTGDAEALPRKAARAARPKRRAMLFWLRAGDDVLLRRRPEDGLLGGMLELPSTPWREAAMPGLEDGMQHAPAGADWRLLGGRVRHVFTHFELELAVACATIPLAATRGIDGLWSPLDHLDRLPTVMRKAARHALAAEQAAA